MTRWIIILAIAIATWVGLTIYHEGIDRAYGGFFAPREIPSWEPAANRPTPDRPEALALFDPDGGAVEDPFRRSMRVYRKVAKRIEAIARRRVEELLPDGSEGRAG